MISLIFFILFLLIICTSLLVFKLHKEVYSKMLFIESGRIIPEQVAGCFQNHRQDVSGMGGRIRPEYTIIIMENLVIGEQKQD
jgi:hypothetical protein